MWPYRNFGMREFPPEKKLLQLNAKKTNNLTMISSYLHACPWVRKPNKTTFQRLIVCYRQLTLVKDIIPACARNCNECVLFSSWLWDINDVQMAQSDWAEVTQPPRDAWKCTTMEDGEQSAMISSPTLMPVLSVTVLDSGLYCSAWLFLPYNISYMTLNLAHVARI